MNEYGLYRVIEPIGAFPQAAAKLDNSLPIHPTEVLIELELLNIDSNSYRQIKEACDGDEYLMKEMILNIISEKGKLHNPVTGSGGMMLGKVVEIGKKYKTELQIGEYIASLVSLTLTPLNIERITLLKKQSPIVHAVGYGILFKSSPLIRLPNDLNLEVMLSALDVCGAPKLTHVYCSSVQNILILGAGKSGMLSAFAALDTGVKSITIIERSIERINFLKGLHLPFDLQNINVLNTEELHDFNCKFDLTLDCLNIPDAEMASVICTNPGGTIIYFNTATTFTKAALGAEGIGSKVRMIIGNGFFPGHAEYTFELIRKNKKLISILSE